jgi:aryl-alcohol dehydrogenase-like predicted oxidoreductase
LGDDPNQQGASRRWIMTAVENSLRRLQTDHIDLYQIHRTDPDTDVEETLSALSGHLDDLLAGVDVPLSDEILDRIDEIVPPGTDVGPLDQAYLPPALRSPSLRRRPVDERTAA